MAMCCLKPAVMRWRRLPFWQPSNTIVTNVLIVLRSRGEVEAQYLAWALNQVNFDRMTQQTASIKSVSIRDLRDLEIPVPDMAAQQKTVTILNEIQTGRQLAQTYFDEAETHLRGSVFKSLETNMADVNLNNDRLTQQEVNDICWRACDTFRGVIDGGQYKDYILVMLFIKYISDVWRDHYDEYMAQYNGNAERVERAMRLERFIRQKMRLLPPFMQAAMLIMWVS